jgi:hypothetical protein
MDRRAFIASTTSTALLTPLFGRLAFASSDSDSGSHTVVFFDERLPGARNLAQQLSGGCPLSPAEDDPTASWRPVRDVVLTGRSAEMAGVTRESFAFCLEVLAKDHARTWLTTKRLDNDLYAWRLIVQPHSSEYLVS